jgi:very-short-patch-repair endonuclease
MAAVLACGEAAVLSHRSAAALWEIGPRTDRHGAGGTVDVSVPGRSGRAARRGVRVHRPERLPSSDCTLRRGIPVTSPTRTLDDLRPVLSEVEFANMIREAEFRRLPIGDQVRCDGARSELEAKMLSLCRRHRLPKPAVNATVDRYVVDFLWDEQSLVIEVDGWDSHRTRSAFEEDRARDATLKLLGYEVLRFTWRKITRDAEGVAQTIRTLLRRRR